MGAAQYETGIAETGHPLGAPQWVTGTLLYKAGTNASMTEWACKEGRREGPGRPDRQLSQCRAALSRVRSESESDAARPPLWTLIPQLQLKLSLSLSLSLSLPLSLSRPRPGTYWQSLYTMESELYATLSRLLSDRDRSRLKPYFSYMRLLIEARTKLPAFKGVV